MIDYIHSWIKVPRTFLDWCWYKKSEMVQLYLYILMHCSLEDHYVGTILLRRGQMVTSRGALSTATGLSERTVRTCLKKMCKSNDIKVENYFKKYTLITALKFNEFQPVGVDEYASNWIKLYRRVEDWEHFQESTTFHLWVHVLLIVNPYECNNRGESFIQGQMIISRSALQAATGISEWKVRDILAILQNEGSICVEQVAKNHSRLITVCKYGEYQNSQIQPVNYITQVANFYCTPETARAALQNLQQNSTASRYISDGYGVVGLESDQQVTNKRPTSDQQTTNSGYGIALQNLQQNSAASRYISDGYGVVGLESDQQVTNKRPTSDQQVTIYKNIINKEIKNTSSSSARAREEIFSGYSDEEEEWSEKKARKESYSELALNDARWLAAMSKRSHLSESDLMAKVIEFEDDMICRGKEEHESLQDFKSHFCDWLEKNISKTSKISRNGVHKQKESGRKQVPDATEGIFRQGGF